MGWLLWLTNESQQMFFTKPFEEHYINCIFNWPNSVWQYWTLYKLFFTCHQASAGGTGLKVQVFKLIGKIASQSLGLVW
jgi:hypothetical protein